MKKSSKLSLIENSSLEKFFLSSNPKVVKEKLESNHKIFTLNDVTDEPALPFCELFITAYPLHLTDGCVNYFAR